MKKLLVALLLMISVGSVNANPVDPPPFISEFYIVNDSTWYLELDFSIMFYYFIPNLNSFRIESSSGSTRFKNGISITPDSIIIITSDSLQSPIHFNRFGDYIIIRDTNEYATCEIYFGDISGSNISAPNYGQSIVNMSHPCWNDYWMEGETDYILVKDNDPTIGYSPFQPSEATGIFTGYVFDREHNPVKDIYLGHSYDYNAPSSVCGAYFNNTQTDSTGRFLIKEPSVNYWVELFFQPYTDLKDSAITIEPNTINYYVFTLDTLLTGIKSNSFQGAVILSCYPNPSTGETYFTFAIPSNKHYSKALIKIYDPNGEIVRILLVNVSDKQDNYTVKWDGICYYNTAASGMYYCKLELDGKETATQKIIIYK